MPIAKPTGSSRRHELATGLRASRDRARALGAQGCFTEPIFLSQPLESFPFTRTYIKATQAPENDIGNEAFWRAARHAKGSPAWRYYEIATNHTVENNRPEELARILSAVA